MMMDKHTNNQSIKITDMQPAAPEFANTLWDVGSLFLGQIEQSKCQKTDGTERGKHVSEKVTAAEQAHFSSLVNAQDKIKQAKQEINSYGRDFDTEIGNAIKNNRVVAVG